MSLTRLFYLNFNAILSGWLSFKTSCRSMRYEKIEFMILLNLFISGTFSSVFQAKLRNHPKVDQLFALKHIIPTSHPSRIETELKCLQQLGYQIFVKFIAILICFLFNFFNFKHSIFSQFSTLLI